jgi:hypothetical protein
MNRTSFIGMIGLLLWISSAILFFDLIMEIIESLLFNLTGLLNSIFILDLPMVIHYTIVSILYMALWFPYYFLGMGLILFVFMGED